jgi:hypothetical protein
MTRNSDLELRMMLHEWNKNTFHDRLKGTNTL